MVSMIDINSITPATGIINIPSDSETPQQMWMSIDQLHLKFHILMLKQLLANLYGLSEEGSVIKISGHKSSIATPARKFLGNLYYKGLHIMSLDLLRKSLPLSSKFP